MRIVTHEFCIASASHLYSCIRCRDQHFHHVFVINIREQSMNLAVSAHLLMSEAEATFGQ